MAGAYPLSHIQYKQGSLGSNFKRKYPQNKGILHDFKKQLDNTKKKITDYSANYMIPIQVTCIRTTLA